MALKDRIKINTEIIKDEKQPVKTEVKNTHDFKENLLKSLLVQNCNILVYCDINTSTYSALNYLCSKIENDKRLVGIGSNLLLNPDEIIKFEPETKNQSKELIKTAFSLNPYKIILQDFDGVEAVDIFKLINAGIKNVITAVNAKTPENALCQMELNLYMNGVQIPQQLMKSLIAAFVDMIVFVEKIDNDIIIKNIYKTELGNDGLYVISEILNSEPKKEETNINNKESQKVSENEEKIPVQKNNLESDNPKTKKKSVLTSKTKSTLKVAIEKREKAANLQKAAKKESKTNKRGKTKRNILAAKIKKRKLAKTDIL
ncbi:Flp pilus assembly complex ATPase component TadA [bacterium]|nr:Flp pilus assembly complex ATPase component TadA [bacterium]